MLVPCPNHNLAAKERLLLRHICQPASREHWLRLAADLHHYAWQEPDHQVIFQALNRVEPAAHASLCERLAAETTRMGFPDIDWSQYFAPISDQGPTGADESLSSMTALIHELKSATASER